MIICDFCNTTPTIINGSIRKIDKTNNEYQNIQELSITLTSFDEELKCNREQIEILTENNNSLELRVKTFDNKVKKRR